MDDEKAMVPLADHDAGGDAPAAKKQKLEEVHDAVGKSSLLHGMIAKSVCRGILQYCLGCVLWELAFKEMKGLISKPDNVLSQLVIYIRLASRSFGQESPPINKLTIGMIAKSGAHPPCLKTKGAEGHRLLPCVVWLLENIFDRDTAHQKLRYNCVKNLSLMYEESRKADFSPIKLAS